MLYAGGIQKSGNWYYQIRPMRITASSVMWVGYGARIGHGIEAQTRFVSGGGSPQNLLKVAEVHFRRVSQKTPVNNSAPNEVQALQAAGFVPIEVGRKEEYQKAIQSAKKIALYSGNPSVPSVQYPLVYAIVPVERPDSSQRPLIIDRTRRRTQDRPSLLVGETITAMNQEAMARFVVLQLIRSHNEDRVQIIEFFGAKHMPHWMAGAFNPQLLKRIEIKRDDTEWEKEALQTLMAAQHPLLVEAIFSQMRGGFWVDFIQ